MRKMNGILNEAIAVGLGRRAIKKTITTKNMVLIAAVISLSAIAAFGQMGGMHGDHGHNQQGGMMGDARSHSGDSMENHQSNQTMDSHMMDQNMLRDMAGMVNQMGTMLRNMSNYNMMDRDSIMDMPMVMKEMSFAMSDMAEQMSNGKWEPDTMKHLHRRMNNISSMMENMRTTMRSWEE